MQFQVPQNLDVPDTIFLGLSFTQLLYISGGVGFMVFLYFFGGGFFSALLLGTPILILSIALSFITFNSQSFIVIFQSFFRFLIGKRMYVWKQAKGDSYTERSVRSEDSTDVPSDHTGDLVRDLGGDLLFDDHDTDGSDPDVPL